MRQRGQFITYEQSWRDKPVNLVERSDSNKYWANHHILLPSVALSSFAEATQLCSDSFIT